MDAITNALTKPEFAWLLLALFGLYYLREAASHLSHIADDISGLRRDISIYVADAAVHDKEGDTTLLDIAGKLDEISGHTFALTASRD